jgi:hypothetical protein
MVPLARMELRGRTAEAGMILVIYLQPVHLPIGGARVL